MLRDQLLNAMKDAMKSQDTERLSTVRMILAAIKQKDIDARPKGIENGIPDDQIIQLMQGMIKQRKESVALYVQANRQELADKEEREIEIILSFLPQQMNDAEIKKALEETLKQTGAASMKQMGEVMAALRGNYPGRMDFAKASTLLKTLLSA